jgi:hypothetical protein
LINIGAKRALAWVPAVLLAAGPTQGYPVRGGIGS